MNLLSAVLDYISPYCFVSGGVYQLSGFAHILMEIKLSAYCKAVQNECGALHQISRAAHKPGLSHLYGAIESIEIRCKQLEQVNNSQLRAMGSFFKECQLLLGSFVLTKSIVTFVPG